MINFNTPNTQLREKIYTYILDAPQIDIPPPVYLVHVTIKKEIESTVWKRTESTLKMKRDYHTVY